MDLVSKVGVAFIFIGGFVALGAMIYNDTKGVRWFRRTIDKFVCWASWLCW